MTTRSPRAYLITGEDPALVSQALSELLVSLQKRHEVGPDAIEEYKAPALNEATVLGPVLDACRTPPFLNPHRLVVLREAQALLAEQVKELAAYLTDPLETSTLVLTFVAERNRRVPAALAKAIGAVGETIAAEPTGAERTKWISARVREASLSLDARAMVALQSHLGEDVGRLEGILDTLHAAYGEHATIHEEELAPYLGSAGAVAPWDLTDAIDKGDAALALEALQRLLQAGERHPLAVLSTLQRHFGAMLALDGAGVTAPAQAAERTGLGPFPARKALEQARRLGHERIARSIALLARADLDLRGQIGWPGELVLEVLVARLAQNSRPRQGAAPTRARARS